MASVLIIGAGGVGRVVAHKCAQVPDVFSKICLASRTKSKCDGIAAELPRKIQTARIDADNVPELIALIKKIQPKLVINVALPYQDLNIMKACLETGVHYIDTANYEPLDEARFSYQWQWSYQQRFADSGLIALLGSGFDPGVTNVFCAYARKHFLEQVNEIDIIDCNAGNHGLAFATNFNPEINIREVTAPGRYYENETWIETSPLSVVKAYNFPETIGIRKIYMMYHEELESLTINFACLTRMRFWMTFSDEYLNHLKVLQNVGMTRIDEVEYNGVKIIPLRFLKVILPDPSSLGALTQGQTCIGSLLRGSKAAKSHKIFIYNICDHQKAYKETNSQAISYTTGVPAMIGAMMILTGKWQGKGVFNMEQFDPDPFLSKLSQHGLAWTVQQDDQVEELKDIK